MSSGYSRMFGGPMGSSFISPPAGCGYSSPQPSMPALGAGLSSPNSSSLGVGLMQVPGSGGSPVYQSPSSNKFPVGGGAVVFTPHGNASAMGAGPSTSPLSPYSYVGGSASSFVQMPPAVMGPTGIVSSPSPYSSTMVPNAPHHPNFVASPITHGYGPGTHYINAQPYGYGARVMAGTHAYNQSPYQHPYTTSPYLSHHHSPRDEIVEPMHCSPIGGQGQPQPGGLLPYQMHRSPANNPPRPQHLPAYLTGIDLVASVPTRPRRVFDRSPSTSPPVTTGSVGRTFQTKSPSSWAQQESVQPSGSGYGSHGQIDGNNAMSGGFTKRAQGQGPSRQLRFNESQNVQQSAEDKEKTKRSGPPIRGFGFGVSEEVSNFLSSPLLKENTVIVPGAAIAQEAIMKAGTNVPVAESNWITVFGFPAAAASFIYNNFAQFGSISQSKCNPGGNWLHIQYASRIDARRALACNGKVLGGTIMVGVISSPREVIEKYEKYQQNSSSPGPSTSTGQNQTSPNVKSPLQERNHTSATVTEGSNKFRTIRPLAGSSQLTSPSVGSADRSSIGFSSYSKDSPSFISSGENQNNENMPLPSASTGILTKAMEYMFGW